MFSASQWFPILDSDGQVEGVKKEKNSKYTYIFVYVERNNMYIGICLLVSNRMIHTQFHSYQPLFWSLNVSSSYDK